MQVSNVEGSRATFLRNVVGLAIPPVLVTPFKYIFCGTMFRWRLGFPIISSVGGVAGFLWTSVGGQTEFWFLQALFVMRVVILPLFGGMRTVYLIPLTFAGYLMFLLSNTGSSVSDGSMPNDTIARSFIYLPYFAAGFVMKRHRIFQRYIEFAAANKFSAATIRLLAFSYVLLMLLFGLSGHESYLPSNAAHIQNEGCKALLSTKNKIETLPAWPELERWQNIGCIFGFECFLVIFMAAVVLMLPYDCIPWVSQAGTRTLSGYVFMQTQWLCTAFVLRIVAYWTTPVPTVNVPYLVTYDLQNGTALFIFLVFPALFVS